MAKNEDDTPKVDTKPGAGYKGKKSIFYYEDEDTVIEAKDKKEADALLKGRNDEIKERGYDPRKGV